MLMVSCLFIPHPLINYYCLQKSTLCFCVYVAICSKDLLIFKNIISELMNWPNTFEDGKYFPDKENEEVKCG